MRIGASELELEEIVVVVFVLPRSKGALVAAVEHVRPSNAALRNIVIDLSLLAPSREEAIP